MSTMKCRACGKPIMFINTIKGKSMPVDVRELKFIPDTNGTNKYVTPEGEVWPGVPAKDEDLDVHIGYISHFATCTNPDYFRNRPRKSERKKAVSDMDE